MLWAFYQSQPKSVRKAFRVRMDTEEKSADMLPWQRDLKKIKALKDNWDEEGAPKINRDAIRYVQQIMRLVVGQVAALIRLFPTHLGAVMITLETKKGRVKGEIGDTSMSYFVKRPDQPTEHHSFEGLTREHLSQLAGCMESLV